MRVENHYSCMCKPWHPEWSETADSYCNGKCPVCNREIEPFDSTELEEDE